MKYLIPVFLLGPLWLLVASDPGSGDWPMWGGTPDRNMSSPMKGIPVSWDLKTKKNVKWMAEVGSQSYGNPVVAGGQVYVGTNNELVRNPKEPGDRGVLMCFRESDGKFLGSTPMRSWPPAAPSIGRFKVSAPHPWWRAIASTTSPTAANWSAWIPRATATAAPKVIWKFDMIEEVGSSPHNMSNSSPVSYGDLLFISTSNGQDESHVHIPSPRAPSMIAVNKKTGKIAWEVNNVGEKILHGQWSLSPSVKSATWFRS